MYAAAIPKCCAYKTLENHESMLLCWELLSSLERGYQIDCTNCDLNTMKEPKISNEEKMREQFEADFNQLDLSCDSQGYYCDPSTQETFNVWQAGFQSRDNEVAELQCAQLDVEEAALTKAYREGMAEGEKACAAIKDAEIADHKKNSHYFQDQYVKQHAEIAYRDLMIKESAELYAKQHKELLDAQAVIKDLLDILRKYKSAGVGNSIDLNQHLDAYNLAYKALAHSEHIEILTPVVTTDELGRAICVSMQNEEGQMKRFIWVATVPLNEEQ